MLVSKWPSRAACRSAVIPPVIPTKVSLYGGRFYIWSARVIWPKRYRDHPDPGLLPSSALDLRNSL